MSTTTQREKKRKWNEELDSSSTSPTTSSPSSHSSTDPSPDLFGYNPYLNDINLEAKEGSTEYKINTATTSLFYSGLRLKDLKSNQDEYLEAKKAYENETQEEKLRLKSLFDNLSRLYRERMTDILEYIQGNKNISKFLERESKDSQDETMEWLKSMFEAKKFPKGLQEQSQEVYKMCEINVCKEKKVLLGTSERGIGGVSPGEDGIGGTVPKTATTTTARGTGEESLLSKSVTRKTPDTDDERKKLASKNLNSSGMLAARPLITTTTTRDVPAERSLATTMTTARDTKESKKQFLLSMDGGGIRGIIPAKVLCEIEKKTNKPISKLFQFVAGTSTGGILAIAVSFPDKPDKRPGFTAQEALDIYVQNGSTIFSKRSLKVISRKWDVTPLEDLLKEKFTKTYCLSDAVTNLIVPSVDLSNLSTTYIFNSKKTTKDTNFKLWEVARATSAAPIYFPHFDYPPQSPRHKFIDGGVTMNNPTRRAESIIAETTESKNIYILSLGTGSYSTMINPWKYTQMFYWGKNFATAALSPQEEDAHLELKARYSHFPGHYYRLQAELDQAIKLDEVDGVEDLLRIGEELLEKRSDDIDKIVRWFDDM